MLGSPLGEASTLHTEACTASTWRQICRLRGGNTVAWLLFCSAEVWQSAGRKIRPGRDDNSLTLPRQPFLSVNKTLLLFKLNEEDSLSLFLSVHYIRLDCADFQLSLAKTKSYSGTFSDLEEMTAAKWRKYLISYLLNCKRDQTPLTLLKQKLP